MEAVGAVQESIAADTALALRLRRIYLIACVVALAWLLAVVAGGLLLSNRILAERLAAAATTAEAETDAIAGIVDRMFHELTAIAQVLSANQDLRALVRRYNEKGQAFASQPEEGRRRQLQSEPEVVRIGSRLTGIRQNLRYDMVYALDSSGIRIASSESDQPADLLGTDLSDRAYFKEAMAGGTGQMFAIARATQAPVFFFSAPVVEQDRPAGSVVVRQTSEAVGSLLSNRRTRSMIVDSKGMVVAASHTEFHLRNIPAADRDHLRKDSTVAAAPDADALRSIYGQQSLRTVAIERAAPSGWSDRPTHDFERVIEGRRYLVTTDPLKAYKAYSLFVLSPIDWVDNLRQLHQVIIGLATLLGMMIVVFSARTVVNLARRHHDAQITAALNEKLTKVNADKDKYLGIAAHDLRNPLSSMRGLSQLMIETPLEPEQQREFLETIHRTSDEMLGLVNDLLDVSVIESGKLTLRRSDQDIAQLIRRRVQHLEPHARNKKIDLRVDSNGAGQASIDPARFGQVIDNLVSNAIKFSPAGTTVQVALRSGDGGFSFSVQDQGPGISEDERKLLFRSFQKLSARPTGGEKSTGLGLAIVKKIVDAHGGSIDVESAPGRGTRFTVTAPLAPAQGANP